MAAKTTLRLDAASPTLRSNVPRYVIAGCALALWAVSARGADPVGAAGPTIALPYVDKLPDACTGIQAQNLAAGAVAVAVEPLGFSVALH